MTINQQPGGNLVQIAHDLKQKLREYRNILPKDVHIANWYDQSELVVASAHSVRDVIIVGILLAAIMIFLFLRNVKVMLIASVAVPAVLCAAILLLYLLDMSFNVMTLGGMAAAVGLIVDDMVVMVEHIMRRLRGGAGIMTNACGWPFMSLRDLLPGLPVPPSSFLRPWRFCPV